MKTLLSRCPHWWIALFGLLLPILGFTQTELDLNRKYWKYRQRLLGDPQNFNQEPGFVRIGTDEGESLVAMTRNRLINNDNLWTIEPAIESAPCKLPNVANAQPIQQGWINWSDATIIHGFYMATLATEWKLINDENGDLTDTDNEIYHAILAMERIDQNAEGFYGMPGSLDGFFIRDDVPADLEDDFGSEFALITSAGICGPENSAPGEMNAEGGNTNGCSGVSCNGYKATTLLGSMSQDQVVYVLMGLRFLAEYIPANYLINGMNVRDRVSQITDRIVTYVRADTNNSTNSLWVISDPEGYTVGRGCCAKGLAHPMALVGNAITGQTYANSELLKWEAFKAITTGILGTEVNVNMVLPMAALSGDMTRFTLWNTSTSWEKEIWQLVYNVLHEQDMTTGISQTFWANLLAGAPCDGPCDFPQSVLSNNPNIPCTPTMGWFHQNRWLSQDGKDTQEADMVGWGEYNGLDYMLAYNLYRIAFDGQLPGHYDLNATLQGESVPILVGAPFNTCFACDVQPLTVEGAVTYDLQNFEVKVLNDNGDLVPGDLSVRADDRITLGNGFKVERGAYFHAWIDPWNINCNPNWNLVAEEGLPSTVPLSPRAKAIVDPEVHIYPTPTNGRITLRFEHWLADTELDISIYDLLGRRVKQVQHLTSNGSQLSLDLSGLADGIYVVSVRNQVHALTKQIAISRN